MQTANFSVDESAEFTDNEIKDPDAEAIEVLRYHVLIRPVPIREKTKGGLFLSSGYKDTIDYVSSVGRILAMGPLAGTGDTIPFQCKVGDYVMYPKFSPNKIFFQGVRVVFVADRDIICKINKPGDLDPFYSLEEIS